MGGTQAALKKATDRAWARAICPSRMDRSFTRPFGLAEWGFFSEVEMSWDSYYNDIKEKRCNRFVWDKRDRVERRREGGKLPEYLRTGSIILSAQ